MKAMTSLVKPLIEGLRKRGHWGASCTVRAPLFLLNAFYIHMCFRLTQSFVALTFIPKMSQNMILIHVTS